MSTPHDIRLAIEPVLDPLGLVVEDVTVSQAGRRSVVRVLVDTDISGLDTADTASPVDGLSLDAVADATRVVGDGLDTSDVMGEAPYVLEVSSPGVGRSLTSRDHFRRQVGRLVEVVHADGTDTGRLVDVHTDTIAIEVAPTKKTPGRTLELALDRIERGTVQVEFTRPPTTANLDLAPDESSSQPDEEN
ncbi:MAG: ribosome maturation factor RimP [Terracoccus sp.]